LIGYAQAKDLARDGTIPFEEQFAGVDRILINLLRIMLNPSRFRIVLLVVDGGLVNKLALCIKEQSLASRGALI
jgi:hypothetical protein